MATEFKNRVNETVVTDQSTIVDGITLGEVLDAITPMLPPGAYKFRIYQYPTEEEVMRIRWEHPVPVDPSAPGLFIDNMILGYVSSDKKEQITIRVRLIG